MTKRTKIVCSILAVVAMLALLPLAGGIALGSMLAASNFISQVRYSINQVRPTEQELVGTYTSQLELGQAILTLAADHTFREEVIKGNSREETVGHWSSGRANLGTWVTLTPFVEADGVNGKTYPNYTLIFSRFRSGQPFANLISGSSFIKQPRQKERS